MPPLLDSKMAGTGIGASRDVEDSSSKTNVANFNIQFAVTNSTNSPTTSSKKVDSDSLSELLEEKSERFDISKG